MVYIHPSPNELSRGCKLFRQWVTYYAKDRFVKHNQGKEEKDVTEGDYYRDFKEYFAEVGKELPKEIYNYFQVTKFKTVKYDTSPTKRIRAEERESMTSLWEG
jgi:hypothetical protein